MAGWTAEDMVALDGRTAVVTGANSGLGYETALALAGRGARVVLACRDQERGADAVDRISKVHSGAETQLASLDLADLSSIRSFAAGFAASHDGLDLLVNNAGVMAIPRRETADGFEMQFGTNHLGHFALTAGLLDSLLARPGARVVTVSSNAATIGKIDFADLQGNRHYGRWKAYGQAKLANQLFMIELHRRVTAHGGGLVSVAAHPGYAATNLQTGSARMKSRSIEERVMQLGNAVLAQSAAAGALPTLYGATVPGVRGGQYFGPDRLFGMRGHPTEVPLVPAARDEMTARRLWETSEELTGTGFGRLDAA